MNNADTPTLLSLDDLTIDEGTTPQDALDKLDRLAEQILKAREEFPQIMELAQVITDELGKMHTDLKAVHRSLQIVTNFLELLVVKTSRWSEDMGNRYTFLVNLRTWLALQNGEAVDTLISMEEQ